MRKEIIATVATIESDGYCTIIYLADDPIHPVHYVILQIVDSPSTQDVQLRQSGIHAEIGPEDKSGYNFVRAISLKGDLLEMFLWDNIAEENGLPDELILHLQIGQEILQRLEVAVEVMAVRLTQVTY